MYTKNTRRFNRKSFQFKLEEMFILQSALRHAITVSHMCRGKEYAEKVQTVYDKIENKISIDKNIIPNDDGKTWFDAVRALKTAERYAVLTREKYKSYQTYEYRIDVLVDGERLAFTDTLDKAAYEEAFPAVSQLVEKIVPKKAKKYNLLTVKFDDLEQCISRIRTEKNIFNDPFDKNAYSQVRDFLGKLLLPLTSDFEVVKTEQSYPQDYTAEIAVPDDISVDVQLYFCERLKYSSLEKKKAHALEMRA